MFPTGAAFFTGYSAERLGIARGGGSTLPYHQHWTGVGFDCVVFSSGMQCQNIDGHGFQIGNGDIVRFSDAPHLPPRAQHRSAGQSYLPFTQPWYSSYRFQIDIVSLTRDPTYRRGDPTTQYYRDQYGRNLLLTWTFCAPVGWPARVYRIDCTFENYAGTLNGQPAQHFDIRVRKIGPRLALWMEYGPRTGLRYKHVRIARRPATWLL